MIFLPTKMNFRQYHNFDNTRAKMEYASTEVTLLDMGSIASDKNPLATPAPAPVKEAKPKTTRATKPKPKTVRKSLKKVLSKDELTAAHVAGASVPLPVEPEKKPAKKRVTMAQQVDSAMAAMKEETKKMLLQMIEHNQLSVRIERDLAAEVPVPEEYYVLKKKYNI